MCTISKSNVSQNNGFFDKRCLKQKLATNLSAKTIWKKDIPGQQTVINIAEIGQQGTWLKMMIFFDTKLGFRFNYKDKGSNMQRVYL